MSESERLDVIAVGAHPDVYTCVTILQVSYNSLGFELSHDYHERTNIFAYRSFFQQVSNILLGYLFYEIPQNAPSCGRG